MKDTTTLTTEDKCKGILGIVFGHKFDSIFTTKDNQPRNIADKLKESIDSFLNTQDKWNYYDLDENFQAMLDSFNNLSTCESTYECSICVRCGKVIRK